MARVVVWLVVLSGCLGLLGVAADAALAVPVVTETSSSATVAPGSTVTLTAGMPVSDAGTVSQEITQTIDPTKLGLTGTSDITAPVGWSLQYFNGSSWSGTAPANAAAWAQVTKVKAGGSVVSQGSTPSGKQIATRTAAGVLAATGGSVSTSGGGDGWNVFFDPEYTRIFNRNHHTAQLIVDCHWLRTENGHTGGARCWPSLPNTGGFGAGVYVNNQGWQDSNRSTGWVDSQDHMWLETVRMTGTDPGLGFFCLDVSGALPQPCGAGAWYRLASLPASPTYDSLMDLAVAGGKLFSSMSNGDLICLDTLAAGGPAACPGQPYVIPSLAGDTSHLRVGSGIRTVNGKVYALTENQLSVPRIWCVDPALITAGATAATIGCAQWVGNPKQVTGTGPLLPVPSASGTFVAVCTFLRGAGNSDCRSLQDGTANPAGLPSNLQTYLNYFPANSLGQGASYSGVDASRTRVFWPGSSMLFCFDVVANATCSGGSWNPGPAYQGSIAVSAIYSVVVDPVNPNCVWTNNDGTSQLTIRDAATGTTGCSTVSPVVSFPANVSVPRMGCSSTSAIQEWVSFTIPGAGSPDKQWASATLSVLDPSKTPLTGWDQVVIPADGILSLAGLPVSGGSGGGAWGATDLEFSVTFANPTYVAAPSATIKAIGDAPQLCLQLTAPVNCPAASAGPINTPANSAAMTGLGDGTATDAANVVTTMAQGSASVTISAPSVAQCSGTLGGRAVDTSPTPRAVAGAVVALYDSSGNPLVYPAGHAQAGQAVTATTDADGYYSFAGVAPANYKVRFVNSASLSAVDTTVVAGGSGTVTASGGGMTSNASTVAIGGTGTVNARFTIASSTVADTSTGAQGAAQTINPLANDTALSGGTFTASTARLCTTGTANGSCTGTTLNVAGQGTYSIASGVVTFTPCSAAGTPAGATCTGPFTGSATPIKYVVTDSGSNVVSSTITPTVVAAPTAANDAQSGAYDTNQTITPLANDAAAAGATLTASTVKFCPTAATSPYNASNCNLSTLTTSEGTYSISAGVVTFDPLPSFSGVAQVPVRYVVQDSLSQFANAVITPTVAPPAAPAASAGAKAVIPGGTATFAAILGGSGLASGTGLQTGATNGPCLIDPADSVCKASFWIDGEGQWTVNQTTGVATLAACGSVSAHCPSGATAPGTKTAVTYRVKDAVGQTASSTLTPTVPVAPTAANDAQSGAYDTNQTITPLANDAAGSGVTLTASSARLCPVAAVSPFTASNCNQTSVTTSEGTYSISAGVVTFDPLPSFSGVAQVPVRYIVQDSLSQVANALITPTVAPPTAPTAAPDAKSVIPGGTATFATILGGSGLASGTGLQTGNTNGPCLVDPADSVCKASFAIAGEGTWTVNRTTGVATFQAASNATPGQKTPVTYRVTDAVGQTASSVLTPTVPTAPSASSDATTGVVGQPQSISLLANDAAGNGAALTASSARLCPVAASAPYTASNCNQTSVTTGEGTYAIAGGVVTFTPVAGYTGTATPLRYIVQDSLTQVASSTYTPTVVAIPAPAAQPDTSMGVQGAAQDIDPLANDAAGSAAFALGASTVLLCGPVEVAPHCTQTSLAVAGEGTYTVDPSTGRVSFQPLPTFTGQATPITYQVTDAANQTTSSTITPTVVAVGPPSVSPATVTINAGQSGTLAPTVTPGTAPLDSTKSCLAAPGATSCAPGTTTLTLPEGTYVLDPATNTVTFTPAAGFSGTPSSPPSLCVTDVAGQSACGLLTPTVLAPVVRPVNTSPVPIASPDYATTQKGVPVVLDVLLNDAASKGATINPASVRLKDPKTGKWVSTVTIPGEGTYTVDPKTGTVTFTPVKTFTGTATQLDYRFADTAGKTTTSTLQVTVVTTPPPYANPDYAFGPKGQMLTLNTLANDSASGSAFDPASVKLQDHKTGKWVTQLVMPGQGTYKVDPQTGAVTFTPVAGFTGTATPITYAITTAAGRRATSTLHPRILGPDPALDITLTPSRTSVRTGDQVVVTLRACNTGKGTAVASTVSMTLPSGLVVARKRGASIAGATATWDVGSLAPGACITRTILMTATRTGDNQLRGTVRAANADPASDPGRIRVTSTGTSPSSVTG